MTGIGEAVGAATDGLDKGLALEILRSVKDGFAQQVAFTRDLVRFPSLRGQEHTAQDFLARELRERG